jgi:hypothetical protein
VGYAGLKPLPGPYEILELADGQSVEFSILRFEVGSVVIHPRWMPPGAEKTVKAMRVYVPRSDKPVGVDYWDITSQLLVAHLEGVLKTVGKLPVRVRVKAFGWPPKKRFMVEVVKVGE